MCAGAETGTLLKGGMTDSIRPAALSTSVASSGWQTKNNQKEYLNSNGQYASGEQAIDGYWYYFDPSTHAMITGFFTLPDGRKVYYNDQGEMAHGQLKIGTKWYLFDKITGEMKTGLLNLADYGQDKTVYYGDDGQMVYGEAAVDGFWYYFKPAYGNMETGFVTLPDGRNVYYDTQGHMVHGESQINGKWYLFDKDDGSMKTGFQNMQDYGGNKTVYYNAQGQMIYGEQKIAGFWYFFDQKYGSMKTGFVTLPDGRKVYYDNQGHMLYGAQSINGQKYFFNLNDGGLQNNTDQAAKVIALAKTKLGDAYTESQAGRLGPNSFDCSGFVYYLYKTAAGITLNGTVTTTEEKSGQEVSLNNLKPGDLLFYGTRGNTYHVGLYEGNGMMIHAATPAQGVRETAIKYYEPSFARRVLN